ncbi:MAG: ShlB/FhaC/HecB family hemolysin secretion/activation protein [Gammaproteobacteria bacterium]
MPRYLNRTPVACMLAAAFSVFSVPGAVSAQTVPDAAAAAARQAELLQRQNQQRIDADINAALPRPSTTPGIDTRALVPKPDASAVGKKCHPISALSISGAPHLSPSVRESLVKKFSGQCLGVAEIEEILGAVTQDYIVRGYITTRAYLAPQDLGQGKLTITVLEGVLEAIVLDEGAHINPRNVFPAAGGLLNLRDIEQGLDQVNKLSSNSAELDIQPGKDAGASRVVIHNKPGRPFHASLSADNQGSESTGAHQTGITLSSDRLLNWNELLLYTFRRSQPNDMERKGTESHSFTAMAPWGYSTLSYSGSRSKFVSMIAIPSGDELQFRGTSASDAFKLERLVYRDQATRESLSATLTVKDSKSYMAGELLGVSSRKLSVLDLDSSTSTAVLGGALTLDIGYSHGLRAAGALVDGDDLPDDAPRAQFGKFKLGVNYNRPFKLAGVDAAYSLAVTAQRARTSLYGSEQILIGGLYSVRGFVENTVSGDHGWYARNELSVRPVANLFEQRIPLRAFVGLDAGRVSSRAEGMPKGHLAGAAAGVTASWKGASLDVSVTKGLKLPEGMKREGAQTWVRLNIDL